MLIVCSVDCRVGDLQVGRPEEWDCEGVPSFGSMRKEGANIVYIMDRIGWLDEQHWKG